MQPICILLVLLLAAQNVMAVDLEALWDFQDPLLSEQRFRSALKEASGDQALILQTQIARTHSLRREYDTARAILAPLAEKLGQAGPEAQVRYQLELGRTYVSAAHDPSTIDTEALELARSLYLQAAETAKAANLDGLGVDAFHMMGFVDTAPTDQLAWARKALALATASDQPSAKKWQASLTNNIGYALHQLGRYEEALEQFERGVELRKAGNNPWATHVAHWMVAWTLRSLDRIDDALEIQLRLESERAAAGEPDPSVFEELASLYELKGKPDRAAYYAAKAKAT